MNEELTEEEQQERNFRWAYGDDLWEALKAESQRLGRRLTADEAAKIIEGNHVYGYSPDLPEMGIRIKRQAARQDEGVKPFTVEDAVDILHGLPIQWNATSPSLTA